MSLAISILTLKSLFNPRKTGKGKLLSKISIRNAWTILISLLLDRISKVALCKAHTFFASYQEAFIVRLNVTSYYFAKKEIEIFNYY